MPETRPEACEIEMQHCYATQIMIQQTPEYECRQQTGNNACADENASLQLNATL